MSDSATTARPSTSWLWRGLLVVAIVLVGTLVARYRLIEPQPVATLCEREGAPLWCLTRDFFVFLFARNVAPMAAIVLGVWCTITRSRTMAFGALCFGAIGLVLYRFDSAVFGVVLAALVVAREAAGRPEDAETRRG
jgi:hypothetical protein